jgi:hypothetical protein
MIHPLLGPGPGHNRSKRKSSKRNNRLPDYLLRFIDLAFIRIVKRLHSQERLCSWLAGNVDDIVSIGKAIESGSRALGVCTHVFEVEPIADIEGMAEADALSDAVNAIACRTPDGVLNAISRILSSAGVEVSSFTAAKDLCDGVLVVEHDAGKVAVETIIQVDHVALLAVT